MLTQAIVKLNDANTAAPKIQTSNVDNEIYDESPRLHNAITHTNNNNSSSGNNSKIGDFKIVAGM